MAKTRTRKTAKKKSCQQRKMSIVMKENAHLPRKHRIAKSLAISRRHCGIPARKSTKR